MEDRRFYLDNVVIPEGVFSTSFGNSFNKELPLFVNCGACINTTQQHINKSDHGRLDYCLIYLVSGQLQDLITNDSVLVNPGEAIIIPPNTPWRFYCSGEHIYFYCVHFTGAKVENILNEYKIELFPKVNKTSVNNEIPKRFQRLFDGFSKKDRFKTKDLASFLDGILIEVARSIENEKFDKSILSKSIRYINEFYTTSIKISSLAKMENMCVALYNKHFKSIMGMPPTKYIIKLRIQYACELLSNSELQINEIAAACGYKDANFFIRVFKGCLGCSPLAYRKLH